MNEYGGFKAVGNRALLALFKQ